MPIAATSYDQLCAHLRKLGLQSGENLVVHSRLISFGIVEGAAATVYRALRDVLGEQATIAVPTYTLSFADSSRTVDHERVFDAASTPSETVGVLSEYVRTLPGAIRSRCPIHSHAAVGPLAKMLGGVSGGTSFGAGSDFEQFHDADFHTLYLGCSFKDAATYVFHVQALVGTLPYRRWYEVERMVRGADRVASPLRCRYYGRISFEYDENLDRVREALMHQRAVKTVPCPMGTSSFVRLRDLHACLESMLKADPCALLQRKTP